MSQMNQMMGMFGQMMCWPMTMFGEMMSRSMQGMQGMQGGSWGQGSQGGSWGQGSWGAQSGGSCQPCSTERALPCPTKSDDWSCGTSSSSSCDDWSGSNRWEEGSSSREGCGCGCGCRSCRSGDCCRSSCHHCGSDQVKLVEYSVVNIGRGSRDQKVHCRQTLIRDCTTAEEFRNEIIAEYAREHPHVNGKNLRVYFKVLDCWCKEDWDYEEKQIEVLEEIRDAIARGDRNQGAEQR